MTGKKYFLLIALVLFAVLVPFGCNKTDTLPQLEIQVVDLTGAAVSGAYVALFDTAEDWNNRKNPVQVWRQTDGTGHVVFVDLKEITYYIYVRSDGKDNSTEEVSTPEPLQLNRRDQIVIHIR